MKTTIEIPNDLINEAMKITKSKSRTDLIKQALQDIIRKNKIKELKLFKGKIDIDINLDDLRERNANFD